MLPYEGAHWEKVYWLVGMACRVACHLAKSTPMLTKAAAVGTLHPYKHSNKDNNWDTGTSQNNYSNIVD